MEFERRNTSSKSMFKSMQFKTSFKQTLNLAIQLLFRKLLWNKPTSLFDNLWLKTLLTLWLINHLINILKQILAGIEDNKDLFKSDSPSNCRSKMMNFWFNSQVKKCWETLQDKEMGWMLSFSWLFIWLCKQYQWKKSWILWLLL